MLSPSPPSSVGCVVRKLNVGGGWEGGLTLMSYCICIPRVLARVVVTIEVLFRSFVVNIFSDIISLTRLGSRLKI